MSPIFIALIVGLIVILVLTLFVFRNNFASAVIGIVLAMFFITHNNDIQNAQMLAQRSTQAKLQAEHKERVDKAWGVDKEQQEKNREAVIASEKKANAAEDELIASVDSYRKSSEKITKAVDKRVDAIAENEGSDEEVKVHNVSGTETYAYQIALVIIALIIMLAAWFERRKKLINPAYITLDESLKNRFNNIKNRFKKD